MSVSSVEMVSKDEWWNRRRLLYNIGLVIAGILAFVCYAIVVEWGANRCDPDAEITVFTTLFQGVGYLVMMLIANLCYGLGPMLESRIRPINIEKYRRIAFGSGFCFSVLLPFSIPVVLAGLCVIRPTLRHR